MIFKLADRMRSMQTNRASKNWYCVIVRRTLDFGVLEVSCQCELCSVSIIQVPMLTSISFNLINIVKYQLCQSQKWQYHICARRKIMAAGFYQNVHFKYNYSFFAKKWLCTVLIHVEKLKVRVKSIDGQNFNLDLSWLAFETLAGSLHL